MFDAVRIGNDRDGSWVARVENLSQGQIAAAAGTVRDMAARALLRLKNESVVELYRGRVKSIDRARLEAFAQGVQPPPELRMPATAR
jgi:hypothetical protein